MNFAAIVKKEQSRIPICNKCVRSRIKDDEIEQLQRTLTAKDKEIKKLTSEIQRVNILSDRHKEHLSGLSRCITKKKEEISKLKNHAKEKDQTIQELTQLNLENKAIKPNKKENQVSVLVLFLLYFSSYIFSSFWSAKFASKIVPIVP